MAKNGETEDAILIQRALAREKNGATRIYGRYVRLVMSVLNRRVRDPQDADDLAQQTFARAFANLSKLRDVSSLKSWLATIAKRTFLSGQAVGMEVPVERLDETLASPGADPEADLGAMDIRREVEALASPYRQTLIQRLFDAMSLQDIARAQGIELSLAKFRVRQGLTLLKDRMARRSGEKVK